MVMWCGFIWNWEVYTCNCRKMQQTASVHHLWTTSRRSSLRCVCVRASCWICGSYALFKWIEPSHICSFLWTPLIDNNYYAAKRTRTLTQRGLAPMSTFNNDFTGGYRAPGALFVVLPSCICGCTESDRFINLCISINYNDKCSCTHNNIPVEAYGLCKYNLMVLWSHIKGSLLLHCDDVCCCP